MQYHPRDELTETHQSIIEIAKETYKQHARPYPESSDLFTHEAFDFEFKDTAQLEKHLDCLLYNRVMRLLRTIEGVQRAIVKEMALVRDPVSGALRPSSNLDVLQQVLIPEWMQHLDNFMDEIDWMTWYDMKARRERPQLEQLSRASYMDRRAKRIDYMLGVTFCALDDLQSCSLDGGGAMDPQWCQHMGVGEVTDPEVEEGWSVV